MQGLGTADELRIQVEYEEWRRQPVLERMKSQEEKDATLLPSQGLASMRLRDCQSCRRWVRVWRLYHSHNPIHVNPGFLLRPCQDIGATDLLVPQVINCYTALSVLGGAASFGVFEVVGKHRVWPTSGRGGAV